MKGSRMVNENPKRVPPVGKYEDLTLHDRAWVEQQVSQERLRLCGGATESQLREALLARQAQAAEQGDVFVGFDGEPLTSNTRPDPVFRPNHYARYVIEPATFIAANKLPFDVGGIIKYVCRYDAKNGRQDVEKAKRFCEMLLERIDREERVRGGENPNDVWKEVL